jgi:TonB family protein
MKDIIIYAMSVVVCSGIFVAFYRAALYRRTSFLAARIYLVASLVAAAVIPALDIPVWRVAPVEVAPLAIPLDIAGYAPLTAPAPFDWAEIALWTLWGVGMAVLAGVMVCQTVRIARIKRRAEVFRGAGYDIALSGEVSSPFSFLGTVYARRGTSDEEMRQIVLHETSHIRHRHSREKIAMEILKNVQWFNPFGWWAARLLAEVHEFEADRDVLDGGFTVEEYLPLIFRQIFGYNPELSVGLGDSLTKKRFLMMKNKMKLTRYSRLRVAGVLPLAAGMTMLFSFTSRAPEIIIKEAPAAVEAVEAPAETAAPVRSEFTPVPQKPDGDTPVFNADVMPTFEGGGLNAFRAWAMSQIAYPREAVEKKIGGRVTLRFIVERDGSVSNIEEISSPDRLLTDEAIRVLKSSPKWSPGMKGGKTVRVFYILPIEFALQSGGETEPAAPAAPAADLGDLGGKMSDIKVVGYGTIKKSDIEVTGRSDAGVIINGIGDDGKTHLLFLDGREITGEQMQALDPNDIKGISVLKDATTVELFGERARDGVILVKTKDAAEKSTMDNIRVIEDGTPKRSAIRHLERVSGISIPGIGTGSATDGKTPLYILDDKEITGEQMETLDPNDIKGISVLKNATAVELFGERARDGVILITTKKEEK